MTDLDAITTVRSGSLGTVVHARNPQGPYTRSRTVPFDPNTMRQARIRQRFGESSRRWATVLTASQRRGWATYAAAVPLRNRIGDTIFLTGQQMHVRCNAARIRPVMGFIADAPTRLELGAFLPVEVSELLLLDLILVLFAPDDEWMNDSDAFLLVYVSDGQSLGTTFFAGPFRLAGFVRGDAVNPPVAGDTLFDPWTPHAPGLRWTRTRVVYGDGRVTGHQLREFEPQEP